MTSQDTSFHGRKTTKLDRQNYVSLELSFRKLFNNTTFRHLTGIGKTSGADLDRVTQVPEPGEIP